MDSSEARERIERSFAAYNRRDFDTLMEQYAPDAEMHDTPEAPDAGVHKGHSAIRARFEMTLDAIGDLQVELVELTEVDGKFVASVRTAGSGDASGIDVTGMWFHVFSTDDGGRTAKHQQFFSLAEALAAARADQ